MIDRKPLRIFCLVLFAMIAADFWQLGRLPANHPALAGLVLFALPASLLMQLAVPLIQWLASPRENLPAWRRWSGKWIVSWSVLFALLQVFVLARALGFASLPAWALPRAFLVLVGIMFMILGNAAPKAPSQPQRNSFELDSWQKSRMLRFAGKLMFGLGLAFALGGVALPLQLLRPVFLSLMLTALAAGIWYGVRLRHEPSPLP
jgi:hypothetical protein